MDSVSVSVLNTYPVYAFGQIVAGGPVAQRAFNEFVKCQIKWRMSECVMMGHTTTAVYYWHTVFNVLQSRIFCLNEGLEECCLCCYR